MKDVIEAKKRSAAEKKVNLKFKLPEFGYASFLQKSWDDKRQHLKPDDSDVVATNQDLVDESLIKPVDKSILNKTAEQEVGDSVKKLDNVKTDENINVSRSSANNAPELTSFERFFNRKPSQHKTPVKPTEQEPDKQERNKFQLKALFKGNPTKVSKKVDEKRDETKPVTQPNRKSSLDIITEEEYNEPKTQKQEDSPLSSLIAELQTKVQTKAENNNIAEEIKDQLSETDETTSVVETAQQLKPISAETTKAGAQVKFRIRKSNRTIVAEPSSLLSTISMQSNNSSSSQLISALKSMEVQLGPEISKQLVLDYSSKLKDPIRKTSVVVNKCVTNTKCHSGMNGLNGSNRNSCESNVTNEDLTSSVSDSSIISNISNMEHSPKKASAVLVDSAPSTSKPSKLNKSAHELDADRRQKAHEYYSIEEKQANLLKILMNNVYIKFKEENEKHQYALCDKDSMDKIFNILVTLAKFADLVHSEVATQIKKRLDCEWTEKPYFGDILVEKSPYYKAYKPVLERFTDCQLALSNMLKKPKFANYLKKLLEAESANLEKVNRIDILFDRLVDFPRRIIQLLESYLKYLEPQSKEHTDIQSVLDMFTSIFIYSNEDLNKMSNFQACLNLQQILLESSSFKENIANAEHPLIKQGPIYKVAKRNGELQLRHLAIFTDKLIVSKIEKLSLKKTLKLNYKIAAADIKLENNSSDTDELKFRVVIPGQNNEFQADRARDKEDWIRAFKKMPDLQVIDITDRRTAASTVKDNWDKIGIDPPIWIKDSAQEQCSGCKEIFNMVKRRHHCRTCGKLYCNDCSNFNTAVKFTEYKKKVRVCKMCFYYLDPIYQEYQVKHGNIPPSSQPSNNKLTNYTSLQKLKETLKFRSDSQPQAPNVESIDSETPQKQPQVVLRNANATHDQSDHDSSSSSSLTCEQLQELGMILKAGDDSKAETSENESISSEELDTMTDQNTVQIDNLIIKESVEDGSSVSFRPIISKPKPTADEVAQRKQSLLEESPVSPVSVTSQQTRRSTNNSGKFLALNKFAREVVHSEYGYVCKIPILDFEAGEGSCVEAEENGRNKQKWDRYYVVLYSDNSIGYCINEKDTKTPHLIVQLSLFDVKDVDETTFGLYKIEATKQSAETSPTGESTVKPSDVTEQTQTTNSDINDFKELSKMKQNLKKRLQQFEANFEIKFTTKKQKKQFYETIIDAIKI